MRALIILVALASPMASPGMARTPPPGPEAKVAEPARAVDAARLRRTIEKLVGFGTRHTLSSQDDPKRGIGAALRWAEAEMKALGLQVLQVCDTVSGRRIPEPARVCNAVAIQRGVDRPDDVVIITGHIDSRVSDVMDALKDAPGANDDGSGTAAVIESARVLSGRRFPATIVYAALSGEEQGLYGGKIMVDYAKTRGWNVIANLNNDIIGNSCGSDGVCDGRVVRVFSEGPRWQGREQLASSQRSLGGENDAPSRNLSRFLDRLAERLHGDVGLDVRQIWRNDRFGRGGDHTEFLDAGYPAVRLSVAVENYNHQHQDVRVESGVEFGDTIDKLDFDYLTKVTKLNVAALAWLASAPPPPEPNVEGAVSTDTTVTWPPVAGAQHYVIYRRRTDASEWERVPGGLIGERLPTARETPSPALLAGEPRSAPALGHVLKGVRVDDWVFGVSSVGANGFESPVVAAVPGGAFKPFVAPPPISTN